jgi:lipid A 3-O-deacylase
LQAIRPVRTAGIACEQAPALAPVRVIDPISLPLRPGKVGGRSELSGHFQGFVSRNAAITGGGFLPRSAAFFMKCFPGSPAALLLLLSLPCLARAGESVAPLPKETSRAREASIFSAYFENDTLARTDRHYTAGTKLAWVSSDYSKWKEREGLSSLVGEQLPWINDEGTQKNFGVALGQNIYTPNRTDLAVPDPTDRPYAGWSYLEFSFLSKSADRLDTLSFQLGVIGPHSYAREIQHAVHRLKRTSQAQGWDHQLKDEFGMNAVFERKWRLYSASVAHLVGVDFVPHAGLTLGNIQTYANMGGTVRMGFHLPSDFGVQLIRPGGGGSTPINDLDPRVSLAHNFSVFLFGAVDGRLVARDIFLDGNTFRDSARVDRKTAVADLSYGIGLIAGRWQATFTQATRTQEFKTQRQRYNQFGSMTFSVAL